MEYISVATNLLNHTIVVKSIRTDEIKDFFQTSIHKHRQKNSHKFDTKDIVAEISLSASRLLRQSGKVCDQLSTGDSVWFVTTKEWNYYSTEVLQYKEAHYRLGKKLVYRHPSALSTQNLKEFIAHFYHNGKPTDFLINCVTPVKKGLHSPSKPSGISPNASLNHQQSLSDLSPIYSHLSPERQQYYNLHAGQTGSPVRTYIDKSLSGAEHLSPSSAVPASSVTQADNHPRSGRRSRSASPKKQQELLTTNSHLQEEFRLLQQQVDEQEQYEQQHDPQQLRRLHVSPVDREESPRGALRLTPQHPSPHTATANMHGSGHHRTTPASNINAANKSTKSKKTSPLPGSGAKKSTKLEELIKVKAIKNYYEYRQLRSPVVTSPVPHVVAMANKTSSVGSVSPVSALHKREALRTEGYVPSSLAAAMSTETDADATGTEHSDVGNLESLTDAIISDLTVLVTPKNASNVYSTRYGSSSAEFSEFPEVERERDIAAESGDDESESGPNQVPVVELDLFHSAFAFQIGPTTPGSKAVIPLETSPGVAVPDTETVDLSSMTSFASNVSNASVDTSAVVVAVASSSASKKKKRRGGRKKNKAAAATSSDTAPLLSSPEPIIAVDGSVEEDMLETITAEAVTTDSLQYTAETAASDAMGGAVAEWMADTLENTDDEDIASIVSALLEATSIVRAELDAEEEAQAAEAADSSMPVEDSVEETLGEGEEGVSSADVFTLSSLLNEVASLKSLLSSALQANNNDINAVFSTDTAPTATSASAQDSHNGESSSSALRLQEIFTPDTSPMKSTSVISTDVDAAAPTASQIDGGVPAENQVANLLAGAVPVDSNPPISVAYEFTFVVDHSKYLSDEEAGLDFGTALSCAAEQPYLDFGAAETELVLVEGEEQYEHDTDIAAVTVSKVPFRAIGSVLSAPVLSQLVGDAGSSASSVVTDELVGEHLASEEEAAIQLVESPADGATCDASADTPQQHNLSPDKVQNVKWTSFGRPATTASAAKVPMEPITAEHTDLSDHTYTAHPRLSAHAEKLCSQYNIDLAGDFDLDQFDDTNSHNHDTYSESHYSEAEDDNVDVDIDIAEDSFALEEESVGDSVRDSVADSGSAAVDAVGAGVEDSVEDSMEPMDSSAADSSADTIAVMISTDKRIVAASANLASEVNHAHNTQHYYTADYHHGASSTDNSVVYSEVNGSHASSPAHSVLGEDEPLDHMQAVLLPEEAPEELLEDEEDDILLLRPEDLQFLHSQEEQHEGDEEQDEEDQYSTAEFNSDENNDDTEVFKNNTETEEEGGYDVEELEEFFAEIEPGFIGESASEETIDIESQSSRKTAVRFGEDTVIHQATTVDFSYVGGAGVVQSEEVLYSDDFEEADEEAPAPQQHSPPSPHSRPSNLSPLSPISPKLSILTSNLSSGLDSNSLSSTADDLFATEEQEFLSAYDNSNLNVILDALIAEDLAFLHSEYDNDNEYDARAEEDGENEEEEDMISEISPTVQHTEHYTDVNEDYPHGDTESTAATEDIVDGVSEQGEEEGGGTEEEGGDIVSDQRRRSDQNNNERTEYDDDTFATADEDLELLDNDLGEVGDGGIETGGTGALAVDVTTTQQNSVATSSSEDESHHSLLRTERLNTEHFSSSNSSPRRSVLTHNSAINDGDNSSSSDEENRNADEEEEGLISSDDEIFGVAVDIAEPTDEQGDAAPGAGHHHRGFDLSQLAADGTAGDGLEDCGDEKSEPDEVSTDEITYHDPHHHSYHLYSPQRHSPLRYSSPHKSSQHNSPELQRHFSPSRRSPQHLLTALRHSPTRSPEDEQRRHDLRLLHEADFEVDFEEEEDGSVNSAVDNDSNRLLSDADDMCVLDVEEAQQTTTEDDEQHNEDTENEETVTVAFPVEEILPAVREWKSAKIAPHSDVSDLVAVFPFPASDSELEQPTSTATFTEQLGTTPEIESITQVIAIAAAVVSEEAEEKATVAASMGEEAVVDLELLPIDPTTSELNQNASTDTNQALLPDIPTNTTAANELLITTASPLFSQTSPTSPIAVVSPTEDNELRLQLARQTAELEDTLKEKAALEARLEETRYLLQMFAGLNAATSPTARITSPPTTTFGNVSVESAVVPVSAPPSELDASQQKLISHQTPVKKNKRVLDELEATIEGVTPEGILQTDVSVATSGSEREGATAEGQGKKRFADMYREFREGKNRAVAASNAATGAGFGAGSATGDSGSEDKDISGHHNRSFFGGLFPPATSNTESDHSHRSSPSGGRKLPSISYNIRKEGRKTNKEQKIKALSHLNAHLPHDTVQAVGAVDESPRMVVEDVGSHRRYQRRKSTSDILSSNSNYHYGSPIPNTNTAPGSTGGSFRSTGSSDHSSKTSSSTKLNSTPCVKLQLPDNIEDDSETQLTLLPLTLESLKDSGLCSPKSLSALSAGKSPAPGGASAFFAPAFPTSMPSESYRRPSQESQRSQSQQQKESAGGSALRVSISEDDNTAQQSDSALTPVHSSVAGSGTSSTSNINNPVMAILSQWTSKPATFMRKLSKIKFRKSGSDNNVMSPDGSDYEEAGGFGRREETSAKSTASEILKSNSSDPSDELPHPSQQQQGMGTASPLKRNTSNSNLLSAVNSIIHSVHSSRSNSRRHSRNSSRNHSRGNSRDTSPYRAASPNLTLVALPKSSSSPSANTVVTRDDDNESVVSFLSITSKDVNNIRVVNRRSDFPNQQSQNKMGTIRMFGSTEEMIDVPAGGDVQNAPIATSEGMTSVHATPPSFPAFTPSSFTPMNSLQLTDPDITLGQSGHGPQVEETDFMSVSDATEDSLFSTFQQPSAAAQADNSNSSDSSDSVNTGVHNVAMHFSALAAESPLIVSRRRPLGQSSLLQRSHENNILHKQQQGQQQGQQLQRHNSNSEMVSPALSTEKKVIHITEQMYAPKVLSDAPTREAKDAKELREARESRESEYQHTQQQVAELLDGNYSPEPVRHARSPLLLSDLATGPDMTEADTPQSPPPVPLLRGGKLDNEASDSVLGIASGNSSGDSSSNSGGLLPPRTPSPDLRATDSSPAHSRSPSPQQLKQQTSPSVRPSRESSVDSSSRMVGIAAVSFDNHDTHDPQDETSTHNSVMSSIHSIHSNASHNQSQSHGQNEGHNNNRSPDQSLSNTVNNLQLSPEQNTAQGDDERVGGYVGFDNSQVVSPDLTADSTLTADMHQHVVMHGTHVPLSQLQINTRDTYHDKYSSQQHHQQELQVEQPPPVPTDPLHSLFEYFKPFLVTEKYLSSPLLKGLHTYHQLMHSVAERELLLFAVFQIFGTVDGVLVKNIKMTQVSRCLKDANLVTILASQLDALLTKINHTKQSAASSMARGRVSRSGPQTQVVVNKTGTVTKVHNKAVEHGAASHLPTFAMYYELMHSVAQQIPTSSSDGKMGSGKGKQPVSQPLSTRNKPLASALSPSEQSEADEARMVVLETRLKDWLLKSSVGAYDKLLAESQVSVSGILLRSHYRRYGHSPGHSSIPHHTPHNAETSPPSTRLRSPLSPQHDSSHHQYGSEHPVVESDLELTRHVWDRNSEQIRQIYTFYASSLETRRLGSGANKLLASIENCKEMLTDFQVIPGIINAQDFTRLFRTCKLWEWHVADWVVSGEASESPAAGSAPNTQHRNQRALNSLGQLWTPSSFHLGTHHDMLPISPLSADDASQANHHKGPPSVSGGHNTPSADDPYDFRSTVGNLSLSLCGFMELITRIACNQNKLGTRAHESLENLMHLMDASNGKAKLIGTSRKSIAVRHFIYGSSGTHTATPVMSPSYAASYK